MKQSYYVLSLPLYTEKWQEDCLNKRFEIAGQIYNALLLSAEKRYRQMCQTRKYRTLYERLAIEPKNQKEIYKELDALTAQYRLRKYDLTKEAAKYRQDFPETMDSPVVQNLAEDVAVAIKQLINKKTNQVHYKKNGELSSLRGKSNRSSILFKREEKEGKQSRVEWKGLKLPVRDSLNAYEQAALQGSICYNRIKRIWIRGKYHFFVDVILKGECPVKERKTMTGRVEIALEATQITVTSEKGAKCYPLSEESISRQEQKKELLRFMERSRKACDGKISNHYKKAVSQYRELCRKEHCCRQLYQQKIAKEIADCGELFYIERTQEKRGKTMTVNAPSTFLRILLRTLEQQEKVVFVQEE